jgi:glycosyltransferase involved in cell wall biosynthesis
MRKEILIIDNTYPQPYQSNTITKQALGGTESSIIRTANILSKVYNVIVAQKYRHQIVTETKWLKYIPKSKIDQLNPYAIIVLRKIALVKNLTKKFPSANIFVWLHTYKNREFILRRFGLVRDKCTLICNSETHKNHTFQLLNRGVLSQLLSLFIKKVDVQYCYNPIPKVNDVARQKDTNKLIYLSSPNKGLKQVLTCFKAINKAIPKLKLYIANPGYKNQSIDDQDNIVDLGSLARVELMQHVRESLCVFYPQDTFSETFGLIYAEANAYKTAVLAHNIGSAREILHPNNPLIDAQNISQIIQTIKSWQYEYPDIRYNDKFSDENILKQWQKLIEK